MYKICKIKNITSRQAPILTLVIKKKIEESTSKPH